MKRIFSCCVWVLCAAATAQAQTAPSTYSAYTGTDTKPIPAAPALGPANSTISDPTFGSQILRVTDQNTNSGESFVSIDSGVFRTWNANSTAIKLTGPHGDGYWLEFNPTTFKVGDGSSRPVIHPVSFGARWEWSTIDPDTIYFLNGTQIGAYNKSTTATRNLGGPPNGDPVTYFPVVIGKDNWVCSAAGPGIQDTYTEIFCVNPVSTGTSKFIDVLNKTINGVPQSDPNWPTSASGQTIGIHELSGGTGASWLEVTFHRQSWGGNGGAVFDLGTNTWSLLTNADPYGSGHAALGNGKYVNGSGSINGKDSRGMVVRNPDNLMQSSDYLFIEQPPDTLNNWCDSEHHSWLNSSDNVNAPVLTSRFIAVPPCQFAWSGEILASAVDGSNTVWRFAHNHGTGSCYYGQGFAQISDDGKWSLFSSYWDGQLGPDTAFGCSTRIDTFIVQLVPPSNPPTITTTSLPDGVQNTPYSATVSASGGVGPYSWSITAGSLPAGLTLEASTGTISGTPKAAGGTSTFTVQVIDAASHSATATLSITMRRKTGK
jgi:putative Ig domain-containing protein